MCGTHVANRLAGGQSSVRRWPGRIRSAGGSRTHLKLLCRQPPCRLAPAPSHSVPSPGIESGLRRSHSRVLVRHTPRTLRSAPRRGVEPRLAESKSDVPSVTLAGQNAASIPTWSRTRTKTLGGSCAVRYTTGHLAVPLDRLLQRTNDHGPMTNDQRVIPGGIEPPISWVSSRRLCRWTTGSRQ